MLLQGKRIFIVEDNLENRVITELLLREHGAELAFDRWGRDAIRKLQAFAPVDIILLDLNFPKGVSGFDIYDEIRRIETFAHIPIVAVSATDASQAVPSAKAKGFAGFIGKPLDFNQFPIQVARVLSGEEVWSGR
ncbi:MAG: response regulator [Chloroflexi bacterium]|nr:response regulator [Chloroflexota bacterium]